MKKKMRGASNKKYATVDFTVAIDGVHTSFKNAALFVEGSITQRKIQNAALAHAKKELKKAHIDKKAIVKLNILPRLPSAR